MLSLLPTPLGNLDDISLRCLQRLNDASVILCEDTRVTKRLFYLLSQKPLVKQNFPRLDSVSKDFFSLHSHNQESFLSSLNPSFFSKPVVYCTDAGMPCISDPGAMLIDYARAHDIEYEVLLGGSAFQLAFAYSGLEGDFCFCGFLPQKQEARRHRLGNLKAQHSSFHLIFYEAPSRLVKSLADIESLFPTATIYLYKELTKLYMKEYRGLAGEILQALPGDIKGEYCLIIERGEASKQLCLSEEDLLAMPLSPRQKSKLLAKITSKSAKQWYEILLRDCNAR